MKTRNAIGGFVKVILNYFIIMNNNGYNSEYRMI